LVCSVVFYAAIMLSVNLQFNKCIWEADIPDNNNNHINLDFFHLQLFLLYNINKIIFIIFVAKYPRMKCVNMYYNICFCNCICYFHIHQKSEDIAGKFTKYAYRTEEKERSKNINQSILEMAKYFNTIPPVGYTETYWNKHVSTSIMEH